MKKPGHAKSHNKALQQNRGEVLRYGESIGCDLLKAAVRQRRMHGFPSSLDLSYLIGRELTYLGLDRHHLYLTLNGEILSADRRKSGVLDNVVMDSDVKIGIGGGWSLVDNSGAVIDESVEHSERRSYQVHVLLGQSLRGYSVVSETTLELVFESGHCLSLIDNSKMYESVTIAYADTYIVI